MPRKNVEGEEKAKTGPLKPSNVKGAGRVLQRRLRKNRAVGEGGWWQQGSVLSKPQRMKD